MTWLTQQKREALEAWLSHTSIPMLVTLEEGEILWCNSAFELLLDYTEYELVGKISWKDLTHGPSDLETDEVMRSKILGGERHSYEMQKYYRKKDGSLVKVLIHVLGYPVYGDKEFFLVTVIPFDKINQFALIQLNEIHQVLMMVLEAISIPKPSFWSKTKEVIDYVTNLGSKYPYTSAIICFVVCYLLLGEKFVNMIQAFQQLWKNY